MYAQVTLAGIVSSFLFSALNTHTMLALAHMACNCIQVYIHVYIHVHVHVYVYVILLSVPCRSLQEEQLMHVADSD